jgi:hypothetical protein
MRERVTLRATSCAALVLVAAALTAGCGASASGAGTNATPIKLQVVPYKPTPPQLPPGHPPGAIYVLDLTNRPAMEPATLDFASDGSLLHVKWSGWGQPVAVGHGVVEVRECQPNCATGQLVSYPGTVKLTGLTSCYNARFYVDSSVVAEPRSGPWQLASFMRNPC